jgi:hypothetical protein
MYTDLGHRCIDIGPMRTHDNAIKIADYSGILNYFFRMKNKLYHSFRESVLNWLRKPIANVVFVSNILYELGYVWL